MDNVYLHVLQVFMHKRRLEHVRNVVYGVQAVLAHHSWNVHHVVVVLLKFFRKMDYVIIIHVLLQSLVILH